MLVVVSLFFSAGALLFIMAPLKRVLLFLSIIKYYNEEIILITCTRIGQHHHNIMSSAINVQKER